MSKILKCFLSAILISICAIVSAQDNAVVLTGAIHGVVKLENREMYEKEHIRLCKGRTGNHIITKLAPIRRNGEFSFKDIPAGQYYLASADWEGHYVEVRAGETSQVEVTFGRNLFEVEGKVDWSQGVMEGGKMLLMPLEPRMDRTFWPIKPIPVDINQDGTFRTHLIEKGVYQFTIKPKRPHGDEFVPVDAVIPPFVFEVFVDVQPDNGMLEITMPENRIDGRIMAEQGDMPADHSVYLISNHFDGAYSMVLITYYAKVNNGRFMFDNVPEGLYDIMLMKDPYSQTEDKSGPQFMEGLRITKKAGDNRANFVMKPVHKVTMSGIIEGEMKKYTVFTLLKKDNYRVNNRYVLRPDGSDEDFAGSIERPVPGGSYWFLASISDPYVSADTKRLEVKENVQVEGRLSAAGVVRVRLNGDADKIAGRKLRITTPSGNVVMRFDDPMMAIDKLRQNLVVLPTDRWGQTEIQSLPVGDYIIGVVESDAVAPVKVKARETIELVIDMNQ